MDEYEKVNIKKLEVRPIVQGEKITWNTLMSEHHYLGFKGLIGESIRYVAIIDNRWVGLVAWNWAALKNKYRESWIGWDDSLKSRRLRYVANNTRFLILPEIGRVKNLASKILALNLKRLSSDWEILHGHPIILAETFVDLSRFNGTCYIASGWIPLGESTGYSRNHKGYTYHGQPKMIFVREIKKNARKILSANFSHPAFQVNVVNRRGFQMLDINKLPIEGVGGLIDILKKIDDPRKNRGVRYDSVSILSLVICAVLSGARSFATISEWSNDLSKEAVKKLGFKRGKVPYESTIRRFVQKIDPQQVDLIIGKWLNSLIKEKELRGIAIDGKTLYGTKRNNDKPLHLLSAVLHEEGVVLNQKPVSYAVEEPDAVKPLLDEIDIAGSVVTTDALHTKIQTAQYLVEEKRADYLMTVKGNQPVFKSAIKSLPKEAFSP
jgi:hypothetical protein